MKKTNQEIEDLKSNWFSDACWDLESTEGFEDHREELLDFRLFHERNWKKQSLIKDYKERLSKKKKEIDILENTILFLEEEEYGNQDISNMETKTFQIRDRATFIPCLAIKMTAQGNMRDRYLLGRSGYEDRDGGRPPIFLIHLNSNTGHYSPFDWGNRKMTEAHRFIEAHFNDLPTGEVIDVEFILGETKKKKVSEEISDPEPTAEEREEFLKGCTVIMVD
jgi:hypothetical protein